VTLVENGSYMQPTAHAVTEDDNMADNTIAKIDIFSALGVDYSAESSLYQIPCGTNVTSSDCIYVTSDLGICAIWGSPECATI